MTSSSIETQQLDNSIFTKMKSYFKKPVYNTINLETRDNEIVEAIFLHSDVANTPFESKYKNGIANRALLILPGKDREAFLQNFNPDRFVNLYYCILIPNATSLTHLERCCNYLHAIGSTNVTLLTYRHGSILGLEYENYCRYNPVIFTHEKLVLISPVVEPLSKKKIVGQIQSLMKYFKRSEEKPNRSLEYMGKVNRNNVIIFHGTKDRNPFNSGLSLSRTNGCKIFRIEEDGKGTLRSEEVVKRIDEFLNSK